MATNNRKLRVTELDFDNIKNNLKKEINEHQKNKNTPWTFLVNRILEELEDEDKFLELFDMIDN